MTPNSLRSAILRFFLVPGSLVAMTAHAQLNLVFENQTGLADTNVFITFQNPSLGTNNFNVTYDGGTMVPFANKTNNIMSTSLSLKQIGTSGLMVTNLASGIVFVSYGSPLTATTNVPSYIGSTGADYGTPFQTFELTRVGGTGDQGNMTAINYFTAPMGITSYHGTNGTNGTVLQSKTYVQSASLIASNLAKLNGNSSKSTITNSMGQVIRYIGPSSYGPVDDNPFPSLVPYLTNIHASGQTTTISNFNAFNYPASGGEGSTNYNFSLGLKATVDANANIVMKGNVYTTIIPYGGKQASGPTFSNATVTISSTNASALNYVLYGQAIDTDVVSFGSGWTDLSNYCRTNALLSSQGATDTTKNLAIGEISSGLLMGFVNSSVKPAGSKVALKDMPSRSWWHLDPMIAFSSIQTNKAYYNDYGGVIYNASNNQCYSLPYSDRLGDGPLVNSVQYSNKTVDTWKVTLFAPVTNFAE